MNYWLVGGKYDDLLSKNVNIRGKRWKKKGGKEERGNFHCTCTIIWKIYTPASRTTSQPNNRNVTVDQVISIYCCNTLPFVVDEPIFPVETVGIAADPRASRSSCCPASPGAIYLVMLL